jgi:hypothetical protein
VDSSGKVSKNGINPLYRTEDNERERAGFLRRFKKLESVQKACPFTFASLAPFFSNELEEDHFQSNGLLMQSKIRVAGIVEFQIGSIEYLSSGFIRLFLVGQLEVHSAEHCYIAPRPDLFRLRLMPLQSLTKTARIFRSVADYKVRAS